ncbi:MAG: nucleotidyltransferase family protein [Candidatus Omnitrophica bacterium]|nr:nucleotidyltransferase family protein [Candidatus Omnitrophota bacterium]MDD5512334.1 nucleotidyltransferase family protein [Candidatus Omnitrophota bacterium]
MRKEEKFFLQLARGIVFKEEADSLGDLLLQSEKEWEYFKRLLIHHELVTLAYPVLRSFSGAIPQDLETFLKNNYYCSLLHCQQVLKEFLEISGAFEKSGVGLVPIKGVAFLEDIYAEFPARSMADVDVLVKEDDFRKAEEIISGLGFRKELYGLKEEYWLKDQYHIAFHAREKKQINFLEVHWSLDYKRRGENVLEELWGRTRRITAQGKSFISLSCEDIFFTLALHHRRFGKPLCFKNILDLGLLFKRYGGVFDWGYVLRQAQRYRLHAAAYYSLAAVSYGLGMEFPDSLWKAFKLPGWKKRAIRNFVSGEMFDRREKKVFLKSHFLLYDSIWEPVGYIINIPQEQFAKFYGLPAYAKKTRVLFRIRFLYILFRSIKALVTREANPSDYD